MTDRLVRRLDVPSDARVHFSECLHSPNIVLLGDPGAGKSHLFRAFAPAHGLLRARDFLNAPADELRGQPTLFIDALDEKRSGRTDVTAVDLIVRRLTELKPDQVRIACRAADWLGTSDLGAFRPYFSSRGGFSVLALEALTEPECAAVLTGLGCADPIAFMREAGARGVADLLGNPQNLTMLYSVVQSRDWPHTRTELYRHAVDVLLTEHNQEHIRKVAGAYSAHELLLPAGAICAARLIADVSGIALTSLTVDGYPSYRDLAIAPAELVLATLTRRVFVAAGPPETVDYAHRTVAEYLAARFLAHQVQNGLPFERVRALISVDGRPATELRGLHAWLAVHFPDHARELIAADPFGVLSYGDAATLTPAHRALLIQEIAHLADSDPWFRHGNWSAAPLRGLAGPDMVERFRAIVHQGDASYSLVSVVLDAAAIGTPMPALHPDLLQLLTDPRRGQGVRLRALEALLHLGATSHNDCLAAYSAIATEPDGFPLRAQVLRRLLGTGLVGAAEIAALLNDALGAGPSGSSGTELFNLAEDVPNSLLQAVLDGVTLARLPKDGADSPRAREALRVLDVLLGRLLELDAGSVSYAAQWLTQRERATRNHGYTGHEQLRNVLKSDHARLQLLIDAAVPHFAQSAAWPIVVHLGQVFFGVADAEAILTWALRKLNATPPDPLHYGIALECIWWVEPVRRAEYDYLLTLASQYPQLQPIADASCYWPIPDWRVEQSNRRVSEAAQRALDRSRTLAQFDMDVDAIRTGAHLGWIDHLAHIYFSLYADCDEQASPRERLIAVLGDERSEIGLAGLRAFVIAARTSSLDDILRTHAAEKIRPWWYAVVAGLDEYVATSGDLEALPQAFLSSAIAIDILYPTWERVGNRAQVIRRPWVAWFAQRYPERYCATVMKLVHAGLRRNSPYIYGFAEVLQLPDALKMPRVRELLHAYPLTTSSYLTQLLNTWINQPRDQIDIALIRHGLAESAHDAAARSLWLATGLLVDFDEFRPLANDLRSKSARRALVWASRDLGGWKDEERERPELFIPYAEYLLRLTCQCFERVDLPLDSAGDRTNWDATQFATGLINALAASVSDAASKALQRILQDKRTKGFHDDIKHAIAQQRVRRIDAAFEQPTWTSTIATLANRAPANMADLHALVLTQLRDIQQHLIGANTDLYKRFWNEKPHGGLQSPKSENSCRNVVVDELRTRLKTHGIRVEPEGHMAQDRRTDIAVYYGSMKLVIELKRHYHAKVWSAASEQLDRFYVRDPEAQGFGIYGVFWFGKIKETPARGKKQPKPSSAAEMLTALTDGVPFEQRARIACIVLDVSGLAAQRARAQRSLKSEQSAPKTKKQNAPKAKKRSARKAKKRAK